MMDDGEGVGGIGDIVIIQRPARNKITYLNNGSRQRHWMLDKDGAVAVMGWRWWWKRMAAWWCDVAWVSTCCTIPFLCSLIDVA